MDISCVGTDVKVSWAKGGKPVKETGNVKLTVTDGVYTLTVAKCTFDDAGDYKITAENESGVAYCTINVNVMGR